MARRLIDTSQTYRRIRDTSVVLPKVNASQLAKALGAESTRVRMTPASSPITKFAIREALFKQLHSGADHLRRMNKTNDIHLAENEWQTIEKFAESISAPGFSPSAGQVASILLSTAVRSLRSDDENKK